MSKSKRKPKRKQPARKRDMPDGESFVHESGLRIHRAGRAVVWDSTEMTEESLGEFRERMREHARELPRLANEDAAKVRALMEELPTLAALGTLGFIVYGGDPDHYVEWEREWASIQAEWPTRVALSLPEPLSLDPARPLLDPQKFQELLDALQSLYGNMLSTVHSQFIRQGATTPSPEDDILRRNRLHHLAMRTMVYPHQEERWLRSLFGPMQSELEGLIGFNVEDVISLCKSLSKMVNLKLFDHLTKGSTAMREHEAQLRAQARERGARSPAEEKQYIGGAVASWMETFIDEIFTVSPSDFENPVRASRFLEQFSLPFGLSRPKRPGTVPELRVRPILRLPDGQYFYHLPLALEAVRPNLEDALKLNGSSWERYEDVRKSELENQTADFLQGAMPRATIDRNVKYVAEDGKTREVDVLCRMDTTVFFVECKAGGFHTPRRQSSLLTTLRKLLRRAHRQAIEARNHVSRGSGEFTAMDGTSILLHAAEIDRMVLVLVTLDDISAFVTNSAQAVAANILDPGDIPWAVSVTDLEVIADMSEMSCMLPHYLTRRFRIGGWEKFDAIEELDWFMHYMTEGLWFNDDLSAAPRTNLLSYTQPLDDYYAYKYGPRELFVAKPTLKIQPEFKELIKGAEESSRRGWLECALILADLSDEARTMILEQLADLRKKRAPAGRTFFVADHLIALYAEPAKLGMLRQSMLTYAKAHMSLREVTRGVVVGIDLAHAETSPLFTLIDATRDRMPSKTEAQAYRSIFKSSELELRAPTSH